MRMLGFILGAAVGIAFGYIYAYNYIEKKKGDIYMDAWDTFTKEQEDDYEEFLSIYGGRTKEEKDDESTKELIKVETNIRPSIVPNRHLEYYILSDQLFERVIIDTSGAIDYVPFDRSAFSILLKDSSEYSNLISKIETMDSDGETIGDILFANGDIGEIIGVWGYNPEQERYNEEDLYEDE